MEDHTSRIYSYRKRAGGTRCFYSSPDSGYTLVEGLVGGMVSTVLAGVMVTILSMNNNGVKDGAVNTMVQSQYEIAMADIAANARTASAILDAAAGETFPPAGTLTDATTSKIVMYDGNGTKIRGFWVKNGEILECSTGFADADYKSINVGTWSKIFVAETNPFQLLASRKTLTVSMSVTGTFSGNTAVASARGEMFTCRN